MIYTGRFAPSPTGALHFGSLVSAVASYLDARSRQGTWLVRIEDIDPPREVSGAADQILDQLQDHGMEWDGSVIYQRDHLDLYHQAIELLRQKNLVYRCQCSRAQLRELNGVYQGHCLRHPPPAEAETSIRVKTGNSIRWEDLIQGHQEFSAEQMQGDFVVLRKDGLVSYQLAVALDDAQGEITHAVRGADLLDSTPRQIHLMNLLELNPPVYAHFPVVLDERGIKLSKQFGALPVDSERASENIFHALDFLGQDPPAELLTYSPSELLKWGCQNWNLQSMPRATALQASNRAEKQ